MSLPKPLRQSARLTIDLDAILANFRHLQDVAAGATVTPVLKADAYGCGALQVARTLAHAGAATVIVAHAGEAYALRQAGITLAITVLHGAPPGEEARFQRERIRPTLNSEADLARWRAAGAGPATLHVDTGMNRLGLPPEAFQAARAALSDLGVDTVMTHLARAEDGSDPDADRQRARFLDLTQGLAVRRSLANSSGIFRGTGFHLDEVRPGAALYGLNPTPARANPMRAAVTLEADILQTRAVAAGARVGYGGIFTAPRAGIVATVALGYADGWLRTSSGRGHARVDGRIVPMIGRVSMDLITLWLEAPLKAPLALFLDAELTADAAAEAAGTIGYEVLTALGDRAVRRWTGGAAA